MTERNLDYVEIEYGKSIFGEGTEGPVPRTRNKIIHYVQINSASYQWLGGDYQHIRYSEKIDEIHPWIKYTVPYRDPLWAMIEIEAKGKIEIKGRKSGFVGPSPEELGVDLSRYIYPIVPWISNRKIRI